MEGTLITTAGAILAALISAIVTWKIAAPKARTERLSAQAVIQDALNDTFKMVTNELKGENARMREDMAVFRQTAQRVESELRTEIAELWAAIRDHEETMRVAGTSFKPFKSLSRHTH